MGHKKDFDQLRTQRALDQIQYETAREIGLSEEHQQLKLNTMDKMKCQVEVAEEALGIESARKANLNIQDNKGKRLE